MCEQLTPDCHARPLAIDGRRSSSSPRSPRRWDCSIRRRQIRERPGPHTAGTAACRASGTSPASRPCPSTGTARTASRRRRMRSRRYRCCLTGSVRARRRRHPARAEYATPQHSREAPARCQRPMHPRSRRGHTRARRACMSSKLAQTAARARWRVRRSQIAWCPISPERGTVCAAVDDEL